MSSSFVVMLLAGAVTGALIGFVLATISFLLDVREETKRRQK